MGNVWSNISSDTDTALGACCQDEIAWEAAPTAALENGLEKKITPRLQNLRSLTTVLNMDNKDSLFPLFVHCIFPPFKHCVNFFASSAFPKGPDSYAWIGNVLYCMFNQGQHGAAFCEEGIDIIECAIGTCYKFGTDSVNVEVAQDLLRSFIEGKELEDLPYPFCLHEQYSIAPFDELVLQLNASPSPKLQVEASQVEDEYSAMLPTWLILEKNNPDGAKLMPSMHDLFEYYFRRVNTLEEPYAISSLRGSISVTSPSTKIEVWRAANTFILSIPITSDESFIIPCDFIRDPLPLASLVASRFGIDDDIDYAEERISIDHLPLSHCTSGWASEYMFSSIRSAIVKFHIPAINATLDELGICPTSMNRVWEFDDTMHIEATFESSDYAKICEFGLSDFFLPIVFFPAPTLEQIAAGSESAELSATGISTQVEPGEVEKNVEMDKVKSDILVVLKSNSPKPEVTDLDDHLSD